MLNYRMIIVLAMLLLFAGISFFPETKELSAVCWYERQNMGMVI